MNQKTSLLQIHAFEAKCVALFFTILASSMFLYFYFLVYSILNVVVREELLLAQAETQSRIGVLESEYLAKKEEVTAKIAQSEGFVAVAGILYASVPGTTRVTLNRP